MSKTEPSIKDRKKFDIDLQYGKIRESQILDMFENRQELKQRNRIIVVTISALTTKRMQHLCSGLIFYAVLLTLLTMLEV